MKSRLVLPFLALAALTIAAPAMANDSSFGGAGALPMPIKNDAIRMVEEHVVIERTAAQTWTVTCDFTFENTSNAEQKVRMGFPFPPLEEREVSPPPGREVNASLVYDFVAEVRGKTVRVDVEDITPTDELYYTKGYLWDVVFAPGEKLAVRNVYITGESGSADYTNWVPYVLETGALWKGGTIGRSLIEVKPNAPFRLCHEVVDYYGPPRPAGATVRGEGSGKTVVWDLRDFKPNEDLDVCIYFVDNFVGLFLMEGEMNLENLSKGELEVLRNTVYARHGYMFKKKKWREHFGAQWWYKPDPGYDKSRLTDSDWELIRQVKKREESL